MFRGHRAPDARRGSLRSRQTPFLSVLRAFSRSLAIGSLSACLGACALGGSGPAEIWTDIPELALAAELFNSSQSGHLVEIHWKEDLTEALRLAKVQPGLAMGRYLKNSMIRDRFQSLDYLFGELVVNQSSFYPGLLALGNIEGRQLLLPVSFDLPAIVFPKGATTVKNDFVLGMEDIAIAAADFNRKEKGAFVRMGFSPRWSGDFLTLVVNSAGAGFRESRGLAWSEAGIRSGIDEIKAWVAKANGSAMLEDDFQFKYLYTPAYQYVASGRALFAYFDAASYFLVPGEKREALDYRWFAKAGSIPISEDVVYAAILRSGKGKQAAESFLKWFFKEDSQKALLESARRSRALEGAFGIAGGFSSIRSVNEKVFPLFYPSLVGHLPPADSLSAPNVLPSDWPLLKQEVVAPWLIEVTGKGDQGSADPGQELSARIVEYRKKMRAQ